MILPRLMLNLTLIYVVFYHRNLFIVPAQIMLCAKICFLRLSHLSGILPERLHFMYMCVCVCVCGYQASKCQQISMLAKATMLQLFISHLCSGEERYFHDRQR